MLTIISSIKLVAEIAMLALVGQWILGALVGTNKQSNLFYQVLQLVGRPFVAIARHISPRFVLERHHPLVAFLLLTWVWLAATLAKISLCIKIGVQLCH